jgi:hypothetical protein
MTIDPAARDDEADDHHVPALTARSSLHDALLGQKVSDVALCKARNDLSASAA